MYICIYKELGIKSIKLSIMICKKKGMWQYMMELGMEINVIFLK